MVHQIAPSAFKMKKGGGHIFQLSLICTLKAIEVIKKVKKRKKDWVTGLRHLNTLCAHDQPDIELLQVFTALDVRQGGDGVDTA